MEMEERLNDILPPNITEVRWSRKVNFNGIRCSGNMGGEFKPEFVAKVPVGHKMIFRMDGVTFRVGFFIYVSF